MILDQFGNPVRREPDIWSERQRIADLHQSLGIPAIRIGDTIRVRLPKRYIHEFPETEHGYGWGV